MLQARLPYFPPLEKRPSPTVPPPDPAYGPRVWRRWGEYGGGIAGGDKMDLLGFTSPLRGEVGAQRRVRGRRAWALSVTAPQR